MSALPGLTLELLRGGPAHNQLLSPLTEYLTLCGSAAPHRLRLPFEQRDLDQRLTLLGYELGRGGNPDAATKAEALRQGEVHRLGRDLGEVLGSIPALRSELAGLETPRDGSAAHLRLVLAGNELAAIPWELAHVPPGMAGAGLPLFLQARRPLSLTREVRGAGRRRFDWDQRPRVLFAAADAGDFPPGVVEAHLLALRQAVEPWRWGRWVYERGSTPPPLVTLLPRAGIDAIREACQREAFTHVHILAHGRPAGDGADGRYGLWLHRDAGREAVTGKRLAQALGVADPGARRSDPLVVTLAACDSAHLPSPIVPGGSVAHDLHENGVPWVIASQLPLTATGSVVFARAVYAGLLRACDPRVVLSELRGELATRFGDRHDWAAVVAYASLPDDFEPSLQRFRLRAARAVRDHAYTLVDLLLLALWPPAAGAAALDFGRLRRKDVDRAGAAIEAALRAFRAMRQEDDAEGDDRPELTASAARADFYATDGALLKRRAEVAWLREPDGPEWRHVLAESLARYNEGVRRGSFDAHWNLGQASVLSAILRRFPPPGRSHLDYPDRHFKAAIRAARMATRQSDASARMWGYSTLIELRLVERAEGAPSAASTVVDCIRNMLKYAVPGRAIAVWTTFRQLQRLRFWWDHPDWRADVEGACGLLRPHALPAPPGDEPRAARE